MTLQELTEKYDAMMEAIGGCGDGNCVVVRPKGMHTNGGCRCYGDRMKAMHVMSRARWLAEEVRKLSYDKPHA